MAAAGRDSNSAGLKPGLRLIDRGWAFSSGSATLDDGVVVQQGERKKNGDGRPAAKEAEARDGKWAFTGTTANLGSVR